MSPPCHCERYGIACVIAKATVICAHVFSTSLREAEGLVAIQKETTHHNAHSSHAGKAGLLRFARNDAAKGAHVSSMPF